MLLLCPWELLAACLPLSLPSQKECLFHIQTRGGGLSWAAEKQCQLSKTLYPDMDNWIVSLASGGIKINGGKVCTPNEVGSCGHPSGWVLGSVGDGLWTVLSTRRHGEGVPTTSSTGGAGRVRIASWQFLP